MGTVSGTDTPHLRIVRGEPDDVELAALTAVVAGIMTRSGRDTEPKARSAWSDRRALLRSPLAHGPGAWRSSGWIRG
jgi:Acyl-CoA carboxylase epsilon subunit